MGKGKFERENLPVTDIKQLESLFADLILWYDEKYCKTKEGAYEVIGEYMTSDGRDEEPSESILNKHIVSGSLPKKCKCEKLNAVNRICKRCGGIVPIRLCTLTYCNMKSNGITN